MQRIYAALVALCCSLAGSASQAADIDFHAGMAVLLLPEHYETEDELTWKTDELFSRLESLGVDAINLTWLIYTDGVTGNRLYDGARSPSLSAITLVAERAKDHGFTVGLRPILDEANIDARQDGTEWRGTLRPSDPSLWFANYRERMAEYAALGEAVGADYIVVGTELNSLEQHTEHWEDVINTVRSSYGGQVTYARNHDYYDDRFPWQQLDFMSVDAFFRLGGPREASVTELETLWERHVEEAVAFAKQYELPLVLTELGTTSQEGSHRKPWVWNHRTPLSMEAQRRFYEAACRVWSNRTDGIYWWYAPANPWAIVDPLHDYSFVPLGKPAEAEIQVCFLKE